MSRSVVVNRIVEHPHWDSLDAAQLEEVRGEMRAVLTRYGWSVDCGPPDERYVVRTDGVVELQWSVEVPYA